jgi:hypothetical protein
MSESGRYLKRSAVYTVSSEMSVALYDAHKFRAQSDRLENRSKADILDKFDAEIKRDQKENLYKTADGAKLFKHARNIPQSEIDSCALKAFKAAANYAMNWLAINPDDEEQNQQFEETQRNLRNWRGNYIARRHERLRSMQDHYTPDSSSIDEVDAGQEHEFLIVFTITDHSDSTVLSEEKKDNLIFMSRQNITSADRPLHEMQTHDVMALLRQWHAPETSGSQFTKEVVDEILTKVAVDLLKKGALLGVPFRETDQTIKFAEDEKHTKQFSCDIEGIEFHYSVNINKIMPSKPKIYHNPGIVQKMILDFLRLPIPPLNIDLTVETRSYSEHGRKTQLQWTIHRINNNCHTAVHTTYKDRYRKGLVNLQENLRDIRRVENEPINESDTRSKTCKIDTHKFNNEKSWLDIHTDLAHRCLLELLPERMQDHIPLSDDNADQRGYVYEYGEYTIIANTLMLYGAGDAAAKSATSYTIIHWNSNTARDRSSSGTQASIMTQLRTLQYNIDNLNYHTGNIQMEMRKIPALEYGGADMIEEPVLDYFIPAILMDETYSHNEDYHTYDKTKEFGGYLIKAPNKRLRALLECKRYELETEFLKALIRAFTLGVDYTDMFTRMRELITQFLATDKERHLSETKRAKFVAVFPGWIGFAMIRLHQEKMIDGTNKKHLIGVLGPYIKGWSVKWKEYLKTVGFSQKPLTEDRFAPLVKKIEENKKIGKYAKAMLNRKSGLRPRRDGVSIGPDSALFWQRGGYGGEYGNTAQYEQGGGYEGEFSDTAQYEHGGGYGAPQATTQVSASRPTDSSQPGIPGRGRRAMARGNLEIKKATEKRQKEAQREKTAQQALTKGRPPPLSKQGRRATANAARAGQPRFMPTAPQTAADVQPQGNKSERRTAAWAAAENAGLVRQRTSDTVDERDADFYEQRRKVKPSEGPAVDDIYFESKFQSQIDALKRTVNELTLRSQLTPVERDRLRHTLQ